MIPKNNFHHFLLPCFIIFVLIIIQLADDNIKQWLRYNREGIQNGEYWRLLTAHFIHLGWTHLTLNGLSLLLIWGLGTTVLAVLYGFAFILLCSLGISLGLFLCSPEVIWYVGLSGVLHGLLAIIALQQIHVFQGVVLVLLLIAKLVWEQYWGALPVTGQLTGGAVIVTAHLYGAIMGFISELIRWLLITVR
jgi:rhomboid family GlyGly-CTERM serine protease